MKTTASITPAAGPELVTVSHFTKPPLASTDCSIWLKVEGAGFSVQAGLTTVQATALMRGLARAVAGTAEPTTQPGTIPGELMIR